MQILRKEEVLRRPYSEIEETMEEYKHIKAYPYIGRLYFEQPANKRILILGHSHYTDDWHPTITRESVSNYLANRQNGKDIDGEYRSFLNFETSVLGEDVSPEEAIAFWDKVAFCNYVQEPMPITDKTKRPTNKQYKASYEAFFETLEVLRPTYVVAWGVTNFNHLPPVNFVDIDPDGIRICQYNLASDYRVRVLCIQHPSMRYCRKKWGPIVNSFLQGKWDKCPPKNIAS